MSTIRMQERRSEDRIGTEGLCYVRIFYRRRSQWAIYDGLVQDASYACVRVCSDMPLATEFRIAYHGPDDVRRATEARRDSSGVVFEIEEPVARPSISRVENDFSFLEPLHDLLVEPSAV